MFKYLPPWLLTNSFIQKQYVKHGAFFGDVVSYLYMGECIGFKTYLENWCYWEQLYADRGFQTLSLDDFIALGGYGKTVDHLLGIVRLEKNALLHAQIYKECFLGKPIPMNVIKESSGVISGTYELPSTKVQ